MVSQSENSSDFLVFARTLLKKSDVPRLNTKLENNLLNYKSHGSFKKVFSKIALEARNRIDQNKNNCQRIARDLYTLSVEFVVDDPVLLESLSSVDDFFDLANRDIVFSLIDAESELIRLIDLYTNRST